MTKSKIGGRVWSLAGMLAALLLAAATVLGVRLRPYWVAKYRGEHANLRGALLIDAPLRWADLVAANLTGADLLGAELEHASLEEVSLSAANLQGADLRGAVLEKADPRGADLRGADLEKACLGGANLSGADLRGADLRGAQLWIMPFLVFSPEDDAPIPGTMVNTTGTRYDARTRWPAGFDPKKRRGGASK